MSGREHVGCERTDGTLNIHVALYLVDREQFAQLQRELSK